MSKVKLSSSSSKSNKRKFPRKTPKTKARRVSKKLQDSDGDLKHSFKPPVALARRRSSARLLFKPKGVAALASMFESFSKPSDESDDTVSRKISTEKHVLKGQKRKISGKSNKDLHTKKQNDSTKAKLKTPRTTNRKISSGSRRKGSSEAKLKTPSSSVRKISVDRPRKGSTERKQKTSKKKGGSVLKHAKKPRLAGRRRSSLMNKFEDPFLNSSKSSQETGRKSKSSNSSSLKSPKPTNRSSSSLKSPRTASRSSSSLKSPKISNRGSSSLKSPRTTNRGSSSLKSPKVSNRSSKSKRRSQKALAIPNSGQRVRSKSTDVNLHSRTPQTGRRKLSHDVQKK